MKLKPIFFCVIFFLFLLISCKAQDAVVRTASSSEEPTITTSKSPTGTKNIPTISSTIIPSSTYSPVQKTQNISRTEVAEIMQTQQYFMFTAAPATLEARNVKCKTGFIAEQPLEILSNSNNQWTLFTCSPMPDNRANIWTPGVVDYGTRYTQVTKSDLTQIWIIQHSSFDYSEINRPDALMSPYRWTADGKYLYLYLSYYPGASGFPASAYFYNHHVLYQLDLETGNFKQILWNVNSYSLSPDDQLLVFSQSNYPGIIRIMDLNKGETNSVYLDNEIAVTGVYVWNPQSTEVVFASGYRDDRGDFWNDLSTISIFKLSVENLQLKTLLNKDARLLIPFQSDPLKGYWIDANSIHLLSLKAGNEFLNDTSLNVQNGQITNYATPTLDPKLTSTPTTH